MAKFKMTLEYDGARYAGWQLQKNDRSVQGELLDAAAKLFGNQPIEVYGAGRTDAGVHARGQVAHLEVAETRLNPDQIRIGLNDVLPHDINILRVEKAHPKFHARHDARSRSYTYQISKRRDAFGKKYVWWVRDPLDIRAMRDAAARLEGFHDFRSFGATEKAGQSTLVDLDQVEIREEADRIYIHITGSHFLWKMVRRMVGVLVEVGRGRMNGQDVETFLKTDSREPAKYTAPPSGLFLERIEY
ncbi:MAG TPA: tRNA pseudouridine(38-40) synthase TruA [Saprospiraceae bacterium]|nr:tRNA pseudouridine(38-40) synthase TruA [Saprospiraceae bacterium]